MLTIVPWQLFRCKEKQQLIFFCSLFPYYIDMSICILCVSNGDFNFYPRFNADGGDLFNNLWWTVEIYQALVDTHLVSVKQRNWYEEFCNMDKKKCQARNPRPSLNNNLFAVLLFTVLSMGWQASDFCFFSVFFLFFKSDWKGKILNMS